MRYKEFLLGRGVPPVIRVYRGIAFLIRVSLLAAAVGALINKHWFVIFLCLFTFVLTFVPKFIEDSYQIGLPVEFELFIIFFIYGTLFLGEIEGYYTRFWWWDILLHIGSGIVLGFLGFLILYFLHARKRLTASPFLISVFSFSFALAIGALWEIFEFILDGTFGLNMQRSGLVDTMWDLIVDGFGTFLTSALGYFYLKGEKSGIFDKFVRRFVDRNPKLFKNE